MNPLFTGIDAAQGLQQPLMLERKLARLRNPIGLLADRPALAKATVADLDDIDARLERIAERMADTPAEVLQGDEQLQSLAIAVVTMARHRRSLRLTAADLHDLVLTCCPPQHRNSWAQRGSGGPVGLLRTEGFERIVENGVRKVGPLRKLIEAEGILFWDEWQDDQWRIVDTRWLEAHAEIRNWVLSPWPGGRTCRFCAMRENAAVDALLPIDLERRNGRVMIGETVALDAGASALTHHRCRLCWIEWIAIASKYRSQAEAEAADAEAGREARFHNLVTAAALERDDG